jgi:hypothetical protein
MSDRIKVSKLNNHMVRPIPKDEEDTRPVLGGDIVPLNSNIFSVAPTACGKTTVTAFLLKKICSKKTIIVLFVSTACNDENWLAIKKWAKQKGIQVIEHTSIKENGKDLLKDYIDEMTAEAKAKEEKEAQEAEMAHHKRIERSPYAFQEDEEEKKEKRSKYRYSKYVFIFDDLANEISSPSYETLLKKARHFEITTITSSQDLKDMKPATRNQIRLWLLFKGLNYDRIESVYDAIGSQMPYDKFKCMYDYATKEKFSFLYVAPRTSDYRINFNKQFNNICE